jgi:UDP-N-acetylglucosamine/UDP-N-acetylgalactosamine diphosphorylase
VATSRREEFAPLKNATGADSPESVRAALVALAADWLWQAGANVAAGAVVEVSPLVALGPEDLGALVSGLTLETSIESGTYFE